MYVFAARHAVDVWQCGNDPEDWVRLTKQLACALLLATIVFGFSSTSVMAMAMATILLVVFSGISYGFDDTALNLACIVLSLAAVARHIKPVRETVQGQMKPLKEKMQGYVSKWKM